MDAIAMLSCDHRRIRLLFGEYRVADTDRRRRAAADTLIRELSKHVAAEERVFYPYAAKVLDEESTHRPREISSAIKRDLSVLDGHRTAEEDDAMSMEQLEHDVADHIDEDEQRLMPRLRSSCDPQALRRLGDRLDQVERTGPTRPHPAAPGGRRNLAIVMPFMAMYDRMRDRMRGRPTT
jgi:hemerythrin superfamily protein